MSEYENGGRITQIVNVAGLDNMTNLPASQQPAPIPESNRWKLMRCSAEFGTLTRLDLIKAYDSLHAQDRRIARLEAALQAVAATLYDPDSEIGQQVRAALSTPLGTPGSTKDAK